jgi:hypothetical protein
VRPPGIIESCCGAAVSALYACSMHAKSGRANVRVGAFAQGIESMRRHRSERRGVAAGARSDGCG